MFTHEEIMKSKEYWYDDIRIKLYNMLDDFLKANKMKQNKFAKKLGFSPSYINQILNGESDHKLSKIVELSLAVGKAPIVSFVPLSEVIEKDKLKYESQSSHIKPDGSLELVINDSELTSITANSSQSSKGWKVSILPNVVNSKGELA